jgi:hypothetical protein
VDPHFKGKKSCDEPFIQNRGLFSSLKQEFTSNSLFFILDQDSPLNLDADIDPAKRFRIGSETFTNRFK